MKKFCKLILSLACCMSLFNVSNVFAESDSNENSERINDVVIDLMVDKNNVEILSEEYDIPLEVQQRIEEIYVENPDAIVTVSNVDVTSRKTRASYWTPTRTYGKYRLQDWIISNTGSSNPITVKNGVTTSDFIDKIGFALSGILLDGIYPFGTAISILQAFNVGNTYTTSSEDKLVGIFSTTAIEKFTYVIIAGRKMLGAKSYYATLLSCAWTFSEGKTGKHYQKVVNYNKNYATSTYRVPDPRAVTSFGNGGYIDEPPYIKIGNATLMLY